MRKQLLCGVAVAAVTVGSIGPIRAADIPRKAPPPAPVAAVPTWAGFYVGGHIGYGWSRMTGLESSGGVFVGSGKLNGGVIGGHWGYNWQFSQWVLGYESDITGMFGQNWSRTLCTADDPVTCASQFHGELNGLSSTRARLGWAFDRTLIYATGGVGFGLYKGYVTSGTTLNVQKKTVWGPVVGGGVEWKYNQNLSFRLEGLAYIWNKTFGNDSDSPTNGNSLTAKNAGVIRAGVSYYFN
jgi:outer membrane immunogenic protein